MRSQMLGRRAGSLAGALMLAASLSGCGTGAGDDAMQGTSVRQRQVDGLVLLTHETSAASNQAVLTGEVLANPAGCLSIGGTVVVLPAADDLLGDGSLRRNDRTHPPGSTVRLVGGFAAAPPAVEALCSAGRYFIAGSG